MRKIQRNSVGKELPDLLIIRNNCMLPFFPEVATVFKLFIIIPVTLATTERSFPKLKPIKRYLRNTVYDRVHQIKVCAVLKTIEREV